MQKGSVSWLISVREILTYLKLSLFIFRGFCLLLLCYFPDLASMVFVPETFIIYNEIVITALFLSLFVLVSVKLLKNSLHLIDLQKHTNTGN